MASSRSRVPIDEWTAGKWFREFFCDCRLPDEDAESYAVIFAQNGMRSDMLPLLNKDLLKEMKINKVGHIIEILRAAQEVSSQEQRSGINHSPKPPTPSVPSKVVSLKNITSTKDSRLRKESEVGGAKRDVSGVKRPVPDEGPTLLVKMPNKMRQLTSNSHEEVNQNAVRPVIKERSSGQSVEVSSSSEKKKKSVFDRLGLSNTPQTPRSNGPSNQITVQISPPGGILKKNPSSQDLRAAGYYGPVELPKSNSPEEPKRGQNFGRLVLNNSGMQRSIQSNPQVSQVNQTTSSYKPRSSSPGPSSSKPVVEPSFHVTMLTKLSNPLVTKVSNGPLMKKQQERRKFNSGVSNIGRRYNTPPSERQYFGSMAADQIQMYKDVGAEKDLKQRLGNKSSPLNKMESGLEKKRVSFGLVRTKEIPAVPGTQPLNTNQTILCKQIYTGSVALRTAKKL